MSALRGDYDRLNALLAAGADPNWATAQGNTALHALSIAPGVNHLSPDMAKALLVAGANPNAQNKAGYTSLGISLDQLSREVEVGVRRDVMAVLMAAEGFDPSIGVVHFDKLLAGGADVVHGFLSGLPPDYRDSRGATPAHLACAWLGVLATESVADSRATTVLADPGPTLALLDRHLEAGVRMDDVRAQDHNGATPLHALLESFAASAGLAGERSSLRYTKDPNYHLITCARMRDLLGELVQRGARLCAPDSRGRRPMHILASFSRDLIVLGEKLGAGPSSTYSKNWSGPVTELVMTLAGDGDLQHYNADHDGQRPLDILCDLSKSLLPARLRRDGPTHHELIKALAGDASGPVDVPEHLRKRWRAAVLAEARRPGAGPSEFRQAWQAAIDRSGGRMPARRALEMSGSVLTDQESKRAGMRPFSGSLLHYAIAAHRCLPAGKAAALVRGFLRNSSGAVTAPPAIDHNGNVIPTLVLAAKAGAPPDLFRALLDAGADVHARDQHQVDALQAVLFSKDYGPASKAAIVSDLCAAGADPNSPGDAGLSALMIPGAMAPEVASCLVRAGADPGCIDNDGGTLLHHASTVAKLPRETLARWLEGLNPNQRDNDGHTPLHAVVSASRGLGIIDQAVDNLLADPRVRIDAPLEAPDAPPLTALMLSMRSGWNLLCLGPKLLAAGADPNAEPSALNAVITQRFYTARRAGEPTSRALRVVQMLLDYGLDINKPFLVNLVGATQGAQQTLLHGFAGSSKLATINNISALLEAGADADQLDQSGATGLEVLLKTGLASQGTLGLLIDHSTTLFERSGPLLNALSLGGYSEAKRERFFEMLTDGGVHPRSPAQALNVTDPALSMSRS